MSAWLNELGDWWAALPPEWMFLMILPFLVAAVALAVHRPDARQPRPRTEEPRPPGHAVRRRRPRNSH
jgi:hypothetical protein